MAKSDKPNILIIWGDDIGWFNVSMNNHGIMGYRTPNIDRVAKEGCNFTDWYGQQSCTAGRAAFITGQSPIRTGLTKVGLPGANLGLQPEDPTIADVLKPLGYVTGQFGKNHLGDRDEFLPTAHGFDEFFGNLYHLNAEQEPECPDYPKDPAFKKKYAPRGVLRSWANADGTQKIENTGPLTIERMRTVDEEFLAATMTFLEKSVKDGTPFFCWFNSTRMHIFTHLKKESEGKTGLGIYPDGMVEHDGHVGKLLDKLDELGITDNTIVMYSTDNGAEVMSWPDGGTTPFRGEKDTNFEGGWRVPCAIRWPGVIKPGTLERGVLAHGHASHSGCCGGRTRHRRETEEGLQVREQDLQGPHRRLQPAALPEGRGQRESAEGISVLERRRRPDGAARRQLEGDLHGAAREGFRRVGRTPRRDAGAGYLQPAQRPVRTGQGGRADVLCQMES
jgi:arylsulfatase